MGILVISSLRVSSTRFSFATTEAKKTFPAGFGKKKKPIASAD
jgi:hypothetical protein